MTILDLEADYMQIELPDDVVDVLRNALTPIIERLIPRRWSSDDPYFSQLSQVADELSCSRASVYGLIRGGHLEAISMGRTYRVCDGPPSTNMSKSFQNQATNGPLCAAGAVGAAGVGESMARSGGRRTDARLDKRCRLTRLSLQPSPPRTPRSRPKRMSKQEIAGLRYTIAEFAEQWWGLDSATALLDHADITMMKDAAGQSTFRYGDLVSWMERHTAEFERWLEEFDPVLKGKPTNEGPLRWTSPKGRTDGGTLEGKGAAKGSCHSEPVT